MARALVLMVMAGCGRIAFDTRLDAGALVGDATLVTVGLNDGVTMDSYIADCAAAPLNFGGANHFHVNSSACSVVALMRFELSSIPPQAVVAEAKLQLFTHTNNATAALHTLYPTLESWVEGTSDDSGTPGPPNWTERMVGVLWTTPGCGPGSRSTSSMGSFTPPISATGGELVEVLLDAGVVQAWIDGTQPNHGMTIAGADATGSSMTTRENVDPARRPTLVIAYATP